MLFALATGTALAAKIKRAQIKIVTDVTMNGTLVKAGNYDVRFNEESGELSIVQDGKVKAKTSARLEARSEKAHTTEIRTRKTGDITELIGLAFEGSKQNVVVSSSTVQR
jgi:hypothetical protein